MFTQLMLQVRNDSVMVCYLAGGDEIVISIKNVKFTLGLPCHLRREYSAIPHSMVIKVDVHSAYAASSK